MDLLEWIRWTKKAKTIGDSGKTLIEQLLAIT
jgi:hypothetical protein